MATSLSYRPDIDGLRAIAVLGVVLYHFGLGPVHGGFVGVDVFFVISGYLITSIIQREVSLGQFTFTGFYERRVRRIFPALFAVLFVTLIAGVLLLLPSDLVRLGYSTLATLFFVSNVLFWRETGYFNTASEYNPLLHTWSLAVEEQFYIGLPILLLLVHRVAPRTLKPVLVAGVLGSLALCVLMQADHPSATFFLSPSRAWELLLGSLLAVGILPSA
ncbi:acyltransferase [Flagellatimonas centrodinii]|uniref:acyltransferase family protein n=1 Tax=Flagellatimonas centrodinii TaxID=2806210 RepID=UPI001FED8DBA|nr:acyltransferase [Flagellatimonas centrodinii]ULQ46706.1 acyltransferase [Flagellatimonas centrodinii]